MQAGEFGRHGVRVALRPGIDLTDREVEAITTWLGCLDGDAPAVPASTAKQPLGTARSSSDAKTDRLSSTARTSTK